LLLLLDLMQCCPGGRLFTLFFAAALADPQTKLPDLLKAIRAV